MRINLAGKNLVVTDALKNAVDDKFEKFNKYFRDEIEAKVTLNVEKNRQIIEVVIPLNGTIIRAEERTEDMYTSLDRVVDKLNKQITKYKSKLEKKHKAHNSIRFEHIPNFKEEEEEIKIVKTKRFEVKPMSSEEAVLQMELLGHNFFVFTNAQTNEINVVYKRKDNDYGLIDPNL